MYLAALYLTTLLGSTDLGANAALYYLKALVHMDPFSDEDDYVIGTALEEDFQVSLAEKTLAKGKYKLALKFFYQGCDLQKCKFGLERTECYDFFWIKFRRLLMVVCLDLRLKGERGGPGFLKAVRRYANFVGHFDENFADISAAIFSAGVRRNLYRVLGLCWGRDERTARHEILTMLQDLKYKPDVPRLWHNYWTRMLQLVREDIGDAPDSFIEARRKSRDRYLQWEIELSRIFRKPELVAKEWREAQAICQEVEDILRSWDPSSLPDRRKIDGIARGRWRENAFTRVVGTYTTPRSALYLSSQSTKLEWLRRTLIWAIKLDGAGGKEKENIEQLARKEGFQIKECSGASPVVKSPRFRSFCDFTEPCVCRWRVVLGEEIPELECEEIGEGK